MPQLDSVHGFVGPISFFRSPVAVPDEVPAGSVAVLGVPIDSWALGRNGQRYGPARCARRRCTWPATTACSPSRSATSTR